MNKVPSPCRPERPYLRSLRGRLARAFVLITLLVLALTYGARRFGHVNSPWHLLIIVVPAAALIGIVTANVITSRLRHLRDAVERLDLKDLSLRVPVEGADEVAVLATAFNRMAERLEAEERVRREFFADAAHELRHPLAVLQGRLEAIQDGVAPLDMEQVMRLQDLTLFLARLVDDLRDLSLAAVGKLKLAPETLNIHHLIQGVREAMEPVAQDRGIQLVAHPLPEFPPVQGDPGRLRQVLINLVANALRHTPAGGRVEISGRLAGHGVLLEVTDTGEGISPDDLPHVFDRFYRADRSRSRESGGSGLGLAIARSIVELHGGTITAESELGKGSTFRMALPGVRPQVRS